MFVLGLTGSIGMGKSTTAELFMELGVPVYDADATVHRLYEDEAVAAVEQAFPGTTGAGGVDREKLSAHVVGNAPAMKRLEAIVHPMLRAHEKEFLAGAERAGAPVAVLDIPLLFETGAESRVDAVLVVSAPEDVQHARILARPNMTAAKLETILARQMSDADKRARADFVVDTSNGLDSAREQIRHVLTKAATMPQRRS
ncbi:dephospho-CoA kinase [[Pseudomonas] carboxydohydrogena]|uniref:Dephospho-CoA kinase n=1 Tax=Afipia carboxydohydrogena TaxID=290 RepID=A0ABY8BP69_AFICR|nr:dephospho-CoA kinase [[Pseudomonas] carboxydohydrogena]WEF51748.1 dephospho-CoA kinase [[Pseudomonas] carboxydohydrogena]